MTMKNNLCFAIIIIVFICLAGHCEANQQDLNIYDNTESEVTNTNIEISFTRGYELFEKRHYKKASTYFYRYLSQTSPDDANYEWAAFFLGICLKKSGLSHAAVEVLAPLVMRKPNPKIVSYSLDLLEEVTRTIPFDRDLIIQQVICDQEYGFVEKDAADFINFYQGVCDWELGFFQWGNEHFKDITQQTYYYYKYLFRKALSRVYQNQTDDAIAILKQILGDPNAAVDDLRDETRVMLARLLYEKGELNEASLIYQLIQKPILEQAEYLLERAWTQYRKGNTEKAMGLLYAFKAPSFENYLTPEYYILKSLIYKEVCHYQRALAVVHEFNEHYRSALEAIYKRGKALENQALLILLLNKKEINQNWKFLRLLESEKARCGKFRDEALRKYLERLYTLQIQESADSLRELIEKEYEKNANKLLTFEEEAHLMEYEIGLDMYQRVYEHHYSGDNSSGDKETAQKIVVYPFQGEFWNDELANYKVTLPDKCNAAEEWDIFFK